MFACMFVDGWSYWLCSTFNGDYYIGYLLQTQSIGKLLMAKPLHNSGVKHQNTLANTTAMLQIQ